MDTPPIREHYVTELPPFLEPSAKYFVLDLDTGRFKIYIISIYGIAIESGYLTRDKSRKLVSEYGLNGVIDGVNREFLIKRYADFISRTTKLYVNGIRQFLDEEYTEFANNGIRLAVPPIPGDKLIMDYLIIDDQLSEYNLSEYNSQDYN